VALTIAACEAFRYTLPLTEPLRIGAHRLRSRSGLLIRLVDQAGHHGYGEAAPLPGVHRENLALVLRQFKALQPAWPGRTAPSAAPGRFDETLQWLASRALCPSLRHGLELAWWDLSACRQGKILAAALNPAHRASIAVNGLLPRTGDIRRLARPMAEQGYAALKLKVGREPVEQDIARVLAAREVFGDGVALRVDANRAWDFQTAVRFGEAVTACRLEYVEEPLREPDRLAALHHATGMPLALDETLAELPNAVCTVPAGVVAFVLKPAVLGGVSRTNRLIDVAEQRGIKPVISSVFESGLGLAYLANCAAALTVIDVPVGLDTYRWLGEDLPVRKFAAPAARVVVEDAYFQARELRFERLSQVA
jgi:o-succinylbenzoate synthase